MSLNLVALADDEVKMAADVIRGEVAAVIPGTDLRMQVDGRLDEEAWSRATRLELIYETEPGENTRAQIRTTCYLVFSDSDIHIAFHAVDPEPSNIRARYSDRDSIGADDSVGIVLDTFNDARRAFAFFVNPLGVQHDSVFNEANGELEEDLTWNANWRSAACVTAEGYIVEMAIPLDQLRFQRNAEVQIWGLDAVRIYPRSQNHRFGLVPVDRNVDSYLGQLRKIAGFIDIHKSSTVEIAPTVTAISSRNREHRIDGMNEKATSSSEAGLSARWSPLPSMSLDLAVNPDFSQVEADAGQLDINTQFSLFFEERRPFFLEGADYFITPLKAVHTRAIIDPDWGVKATAKEGVNTIGFFSSRDSVTNILIPGSERSRSISFSQKNISSVFRYRRDVGSGSTIGLLATDREGEEYHNRVTGLDGLIRLNDSNSMAAQFLFSSTDYPETIVQGFGQPEGEFSDTAIDLLYRHKSRNLDLNFEFFRIGDGFRSDLGFIAEADISKFGATGAYTFWGGEDDLLTKITLNGDYIFSYDSQGFLERNLLQWIGFDGPLQSQAGIGIQFETKRFHEEIFNPVRIGLYYAARPAGNIFVEISEVFGSEIDFDNVRFGSQNLFKPSIVYNFGRHLSIGITHTYQRFSLENSRLFLANLSEMNLYYHFNVRTFVRAVVQRTDIRRNPELYSFPVDSKSRDLLLQLLFSYTLNPQSVVYIGYSDAQNGISDFDSSLRNRTFFIKIGYSWSM